MPLLLAVLCLPPLALLAVQARRGLGRAEWLRVGLLFALGLFVTGPLQHERALGAGDAGNYAHAVADTVVQLRSGVFPVFVGQSLYAFNGRIHPLRTAPYYTYAAGLLDLLTAHRLNFWGLQNGLLALSLMGGIFSTYVCLRRLGPAGPWTAAGLAAAYGLSPGLLACAYGQDLYMTVTTGPFIPVALLGAIRAAGDRSFRAGALMAIGLAALWLAHPPIAAWISLGCAGLLAASWLTRRPTWRAAGALALAAGLGLTLSLYGFVSALSLDDHVIGSAPQSFKALTVDALGAILREHWRASLRPVTTAPTGLGAFQLGYVLWTLLLACAALGWRRGAIGRTLAGGLIFYLLLVLPVPGVSRPLWMLLPFAFTTLTNIWPMQRAYLVLAAWTVFAAAWILPGLSWGRRRGTHGRPVAMAVLGVAALWTCGQAGRFVLSGYLNQQDDADSALLHRPENANLTVTGYAILRPPSTFTGGTMEPEREFRLIRPGDGRPLLDNWGPESRAAVTAHGWLRVAGGDRNGLRLAPGLPLYPGKHYVLRLRFVVPPFDAALLLDGGTLHREYHLPSYIGAHGFGMNPGNNPALPLWTTGPVPSLVRLRLASGDPRLPLAGNLAEFTLEETDRERLPVKLEALVPELRCRVRAPEDAWLVTPRMWTRGYAAQVDGQPARTIRSDEGMVLVAVPAGTHEVALRYEGFPALRWAFYTSFVGWLGVLGMAGAAGWRAAIGGPAAAGDRPTAPGPKAGQLTIPGAEVRTQPAPPEAGTRERTNRGARPPSAGVPRSGAARTGRRTRRAVAGGLLIAAAAAAATFGWTRWRGGAAAAAAGPLELRFWLPIATMGDVQVLVTSGPPADRSTVFLRYLDSAHVEVGLDALHRGYAVSPPVAVSYSQLQTLVVSTGALYPAGAPLLAGRSPAELDWLRGTLRIWLNGREVLSRRLSDYRPGDPAVEVTSERTGGTGVLHGFTGTVVSSRRLPVAAAGYPLNDLEAVRAGTGPIHLRFALPNQRIGRSEPILAMGRPGGSGIVLLKYLDEAHLQVGFEPPGRAPFLSAPLTVDYGHAHDLTVSAGGLYPASGPTVRSLTERDLDWLHSHVRIEFDGRTVLARQCELPHSAPAEIEFGHQSLGSSFMEPAFTGVFLGLDRRTPGGSGDLPTASAQPGRRAGPLRIQVRLPANRLTRSEPLVTAGTPGHALFLFVNYLDATHLRIGLDVWGTGVLAYGEPVAYDPTALQEFLVTAGSLYPADDPPVAALDPAERTRLQHLVAVSLNHRVIFERRVETPSTSPETVTIGESRIGGSNVEARFTGDVLDYERLPPAAAADRPER
jgi:hypothetical protein